MAIHPVEFRYNTPEMYAIFTEENILAKRLEVQAALAKAHAKVGNIPKKDADTITAKANTEVVKIERVNEIEAEIYHDLMAIVKALSEQCGEAGKYVHYGATSYDIVDTSWALIFKEALDVLEKDLLKFKKVLADQARKYRDVVMVGRTHGQHAVPITLGMKFAVWLAENHRNLKRIQEAKELIGVGKLTGAVGTQASLGSKGLEIQKEFLRVLKLNEPLITTQIIQRDRHAEVIAHLAIISRSLAKIGGEIRNLQRPEILEVEEPFKRKQVGSSTMPQKRNPFRSERICGISRVICSNVMPALENVPSEHERDLTNSSTERIIFPETFVLTGFILRETIDILENLVVYPDNMRRNIELSNGRLMGEAVMIKLTGKGMSRQDAHELVRKSAMKSFETGKNLKDILKENARVGKLLNEKELEEVMEPSNYLGTIKEQINRVLKECG